MWVALVIFGLTYAAMASARSPLVPIDRPTAALVGAAAMVLAGVIDFEDALAAIDVGVVALLLGVMILAAYLQRAQVFRFAAWWVLTRARSPVRLLWGLVFVAGGFSALLLNDTICLMFTPLVVAVVVEARLPALPYLFALATATNIGGVVTFTGNPQNMIIGQAAAGAPSYLEYLAHALPVGLACLCVDAALLAWLFRRELAAATLGERSAQRPHLDRPLALKALAAVALFVAAAVAGLSMPAAAISAAVLLMLVARAPLQPTLAAVDLSLLLFFAGLFVVVHAVSAAGAIDWAIAPVGEAIAAGGLAGDAAFAALTVAGSNVVSNVPFVMIAVQWVPALPDPAHGYALLAIASTLAGNLTLFGSVANVIVFDSAGAHGKIGFFRFLRYGAVLTAASLVTAFAVLSVAELVFGG